MRSTFAVPSIQWIKDRIIKSGAEPWVRPLWMKVTGKRPSPYDADLSRVIARVLRPDSTCIDVGAHKGLILDICMRHAPGGTFHAFEPLPYLYQLLRRKYRWNSNVKLYDLALSDSAGKAAFDVNKAFPGLSGLSAPVGRQRDKSEIEACEVSVARLDDVLPEARADLIKIDVEGAELGVLKGAQRLLARSRPVVAFEHGLGGADRFGSTPEQVYDLLAGVGLKLSLMTHFLENAPSLSRGEFCDEFYSHTNYFFIGHP